MPVGLKLVYVPVNRVYHFWAQLIQPISTRDTIALSRAQPECYWVCGLSIHAAKKYSINIADMIINLFYLALSSVHLLACAAELTSWN